MAACDDCFQKFVHPLVHAGMDKNDAFERRYGHHARWDWDDSSSTLTFSDPNQQSVRIHCSVVGTTQGNQWQWSWANNNISPYSKLDMEKVHDFGEANGYEKLTTPFLEADKYTGWEMTAVAEHILDALGAYRFPTDLGYRYLIYRKIEEVGTEAADDLHGAMRGTATIPPDVDLTESTGEIWDAQQ
ncbi:MAG: DUF6882 domain-containing protein [Terracidiphilus sp.]|jgi:hypothetical protein